MREANIGKLLPVDGFIIKVPQSVQVDINKSLSHLYQPLIGATAISLYQTLLSEYDLQQQEGAIKTHHLLMNYLHMPLDQIYDARTKLEAIGLMRTFVHSENDQQIYSYVLLRPFTPNEFFDDDMLSLLLYHHLGSDKFERLRQLFYHKPNIDSSAKEITSSFENVFSLHSISKDEAASKAKDEERQETSLSNSASGVNMKEDSIDYNALQNSLRQQMLPVQAILTEKNKRVLSQLAMLYSLATYELEKAILWSLNDENELIVEELKEACHDLYQNKNNHGEPPKVNVVDHREKVVPSKEENKKVTNKEEALIQQLEEISPRELLEDLSNGVEPPEKDLKIIREIMTQQGLSPGVMNVLIYYVLLKTDMKMSKPYMETIAGHWTRLKIQTVRQAMEVAKSENRKYQEWATKKKYGGSKYGKQEVLPDWFKEQKKSKQQKPKQQEAPEESNKSQQQIDKEKEEILQAIKNRSKKRQRNNQV